MYMCIYLCLIIVAHRNAIIFAHYTNEIIIIIINWNETPELPEVKYTIQYENRPDIIK